jgi:hypothetical protein
MACTEASNPRCVTSWGYSVRYGMLELASVNVICI